MDVQKLVKLMNLTASDSDGEALNALRAANRLLKKSDKRWEDLLLVKPQSRTYEKYRKSEPTVEEMLKYCSQHVHGHGLVFISSLQNYFTVNGRLTVAQTEALKKFYANARRATA